MSRDTSRPDALDTDEMTALVKRLRSGAGDGPALFQRHFRDPLIRFCWGYLGTMEEAEDALQEISYKVITAESIPDRFRAWLYKIARNHCLNVLRDRARHGDVGAVPADSRVHESLTGHLTRLVNEEMQSRINELVLSLPEAQREVLRLRYVEDLSRSEIAEVLDVSETVVKSRLFESLQRLREHTSLLEDTP